MTSRLAGQSDAVNAKGWRTCRVVRACQDRLPKVISRALQRFDDTHMIGQPLDILIPPRILIVCSESTLRALHVARIQFLHDSTVFRHQVRVDVHLFISPVIQARILIALYWKREDNCECTIALRPGRRVDPRLAIVNESQSLVAKVKAVCLW